MKSIQADTVAFDLLQSHADQLLTVQNSFETEKTNLVAWTLRANLAVRSEPLLEPFLCASAQDYMLAFHKSTAEYSTGVSYRAIAELIKSWVDPSSIKFRVNEDFVVFPNAKEALQLQVANDETLDETLEESIGEILENRLQETLETLEILEALETMEEIVDEQHHNSPIIRFMTNTTLADEEVLVIDGMFIGPEAF